MRPHHFQPYKSVPASRTGGAPQAGQRTGTHQRVMIQRGQEWQGQPQSHLSRRVALIGKEVQRNVKMMRPPNIEASKTFKSLGEKS